MADDDASRSDAPTSSSTSSNIPDRTSLIEKARAFLLSPSVRNENDAAKHTFLEEKGLTGEEIDVLIRELPRQPPPVPPRTYSQPPPSNLPVLLASLFRAFTWAAGISGVLFLGYYRLLLPRLTRSLGARHMLKVHQSELLGRLRGRINELKESQEEVYDVRPRPEDGLFPADIKSLADLPVDSAGEPTHPLGVVVGCAFLREPEQRLTLDEVYLRLLNQFPALARADEWEYKHFISRELSRSRSFDKIQEGDLEYWSFRQEVDSSLLSTPTRPISSTQSLENLRDAVSRGQRGANSYQHTFKSLTDLTAYLSRENFALHGTSSGFRYGLQGGPPLGPAEEDVRREIRALKGLVLNRRTFAPSPYRPPTAPTVASTS